MPKKNQKNNENNSDIIADLVSYQGTQCLLLKSNKYDDGQRLIALSPEEFISVVRYTIKTVKEFEKHKPNVPENQVDDIGEPISNTSSVF
jgi:hypothetical protein